MSREADNSAGARSPLAQRRELQALFEAKAQAELKLANALAPGSDIVRSRGALLAQVALVKGLPGPAEASGGAALSGPDGTAADAALARLGYDPQAAYRILSRPEPTLEPEARMARLRLALEAVDPAVIIALDAEAASDVRDAFATARLAFGRPIRSGGRTLLAVDGLEASLVDASRKRRVWRQMQTVRFG